MSASATVTSHSSIPIRETRPSRDRSLFRWTHGLITRMVTLGDLAALLVGSLVHPWLYHQMLAPLTLAQSLFLFAIEAVVFLFVMQTASAYRVENYARMPVSLASVIFGMTCAWAVGTGYVLAFAPGLTVAGALLLTCRLPQMVLLILVRLAVWRWVTRIDRLALMRRNTLVVGCGDEAADMVARLADPARAAEFNVMGIVSDEDDRSPGLLAGHPVLGGLSTLATFGHRHAVDLVVIAIPLSGRARLPRAIEALQWLSADVVLSLDATTAQAADQPLQHVAGRAVLPLIRKPLKGSQSLLKTAEDRLISAIALVVLCPLMLLTALAIRLDSPGPALFRQDRIGLHNRTFRIFKFRTMTVDPTDDGAKGTTSRTNPRITRVGGVLRRLSLDELPQLLNVLIGDMSIVGPRPYVRNMLVEDQTFDAAVRRFAARHRIKPGITGLAQANGFRSNALRNKLNAATSVQLDMDYITNWSLWLDLKIMFRTVTRAMSGPEVF